MKNVIAWIMACTMAVICLAACGGGGGEGGTNSAPIANAGPDQNVMINSKVTLDGSGSINASAYNWSLTRPSGSTATLSSTAASRPTFTADVAGSYTASLVVSSGTATSSPDTVTILSVSTRAVPDTGQTTIYAAGDDGAYTTNPPSYTDNLDGTVTDNVTGLMWQKCSMGKSGSGCATGTLGAYNWYQATGTVDSTYNPGGMNACGGTFLGHSDWRLPTDFELMIIADYGNSGMAINAVFPGVTPAFYWSAAGSAVGSGTSAWAAEFYDGQLIAIPKTSGTNAVRCVRGGQSVADFTDNNDGTITDNVTGLMWQKQDDGVAKDWATALSSCEGLTLAGHPDWRMPNVKELRSIADTTKYGPSVDTAFFPVTQTSYYWSSTSWAGNAANVALTVSFNSGSVNNTELKTTSSYVYVRCVRSLQ